MSTFSVTDTTLSFVSNSNSKECSHYQLFDELMHFLGQIGFYVGKDKMIEKNYKILSKDRRQGRYADLEFKAERYLKGFKITFYQNLVFVNRYGGYYDFDKFEKMPYIVKKQFILTIKKISQFLGSKGVKDISETVCKTAEDKIKMIFVKSMHHPQKDMNFSLSDLDGTNNGYFCDDRNGKEIKNGEVKYSRDGNGYFIRGKVYQDINSRWIMNLNKKQICYLDNTQLFDLSAADLAQRRKKQSVEPKKYKDKRTALSNATNKELLNELKRRNVIKKGKITQ